MRTYYHATPYYNLSSIIESGIHRGVDKVIYLTEDPRDAAKFVAIRGCVDILVLEVELDESQVKESFDHSEAFFQCRAYTYDNDIHFIDIVDFQRFTL